MSKCVVIALAAGLSSAAFGAETLRLVDTTPGGGFSGPYVFANGGGSGFGGLVGGGSVAMDSDFNNLYLTFVGANGAPFNDNVFIMLDTREGGFTDADMADRADGGRRAVSELSLDGDDPFDPNFLPDFGLVIGSFGTVLFELTAGDTDGHLIFTPPFDATGTLPRDYALSLATLGVAPGGEVKWFAGYVSDSGFLSNESIPASEPLNSGDNPGFGGGSLRTAGNPGFLNYNTFVTVPTPGATALGLIAGVMIVRRRRNA